MLCLTLSLMCDLMPMPEVPVKEPTNLIIEKLIACESSGNPLALNKKDAHGESIGILQYRRETFREQMIKYHFIDTSEWEESDWENAIWDSIIQKKLARLMIADNLGGRWGCWNKIK